jgi:hypothetical protein
MLGEMVQMLFKKGVYKDSQEGMTPILQDFPSILPLANILLTLLINPRDRQQLVLKTISDYSLGLTIPRLLTMKPQDQL